MGKKKKKKGIEILYFHTMCIIKEITEASLLLLINFSFTTIRGRRVFKDRIFRQEKQKSRPKRNIHQNVQLPILTIHPFGTSSFFLEQFNLRNSFYCFFF